MQLQAQVVSIPQDRPADKRLELNKSPSHPLGYELPDLTKPAILTEYELNGGQHSKGETNEYKNKVSENSVPVAFIKEIKFTGNTVIKDVELNNVVKRYLNSRLSQKDLSEIRNKVTSYYVSKGYINSGAYLPDQDLTQSVLIVAIIEGKLSNINVVTSADLSKDNIISILGISSDSVLNINALKNRLYILQQEVLVEKINARLQATDIRGYAELELEITGNDPLDLAFFVNNYRPPSVGEYQGVVTASHLNISGNGDIAVFSVSGTEGLVNYDLSYEYPVIPGKFNLGFSVRDNNSDVVERPFNLIDIENSSSSWALQAKYKYHKALNEELNLYFFLESKSSETTIDGSSFNFNDINTDDTRASIIRFSQEWSSRNINQAYVVRSTFSFGLDKNDATILENSPDGEFVSWLAQLQWLRKINFNHTAHIQLSTQLSDDALLPFEQYASGGRYSVRGYRENQFIRDLGITLNLEYKIPAQFNSIDYPVDFIIFSDLSTIKNKNRQIDSKESIASIGIGLQGRFSKDTGYEIMWAHAPEKQSLNEEDALQDDGVHFQLFMHY